VQLGGFVQLTLNEEERVALIEFAELAIEVQEACREVRTLSEDYGEEWRDVAHVRARIFRTVGGVLERLAVGSPGALDGHEVARNARDLATTLINLAAR